MGMVTDTNPGQDKDSWGVKDPIKGVEISQEKLKQLRIKPQDILREVAESASEQGERLAQLAERFDQQLPPDQEMLDILDGMMAALEVSDDGKVMGELDADKWQDVRDWLAGDDEKITELVERKRAVLRRYEDELAMGEIASAAAQTENEFLRDVEPIPLDEIALVRSSKHPFERDKHGNVVIHSAAHYTDDVVRQTVHFSLNHQVTSHGEGSWEDSNYLVVGNLAKAIDANGALASMTGVDSWWAVNPDQPVVLPDAIVIAPSTDNGELISDNPEAAIISYKHLPDGQYTDDEKTKIRELLYKYHLENAINTPSLSYQLREIALREAMVRSGVSDFSTMPQGGSHGTQDFGFDMRVRKTAGLQGSASMSHFDSRFSGIYRDTHRERNQLGAESDPYNHKSGRQELDPNTPLQVKRRLLLSGGVVRENLPEDLRGNPFEDDLDITF
jgi:hypothetical protein